MLTKAQAGTSRVSRLAQKAGSAVGSSFYYSFLLLPSAKRKAVKTVYAFCRILDDIVDQDPRGRNPAAEIEEWRRELELCYQGQPSTRFGEELTDAIEEFELPKQSFVDLIDGMEMDLNWQSYQSFADLREYCYRVASAVGLICIEIFGYELPRTREYAVNLGLALQLTNILRDLREDAQRGRIYIPIEDLERFGYSEKDVKSNVYNTPFVNLMRFQVTRARTYFERAEACLSSQDRPSMFAAEIMGAIYREILEAIPALQYNVFRERATVSKKRRIQIALGTWFKSKVERR
jgi:15-cis-phytoene synthase